MEGHIESTVKMTSCLHIGLLCLVVLVDGLPYDEPTACADVNGVPQFFDDTQCKPCPTCRQGYGLSEICGNGRGVNAVCEVCPEGFFSDDDSVEMCRSCRICFDTEEDAVPCTSTSDRKCGQCRCGYFRYEERHDHCARCADEKSSHLYDECSRPCPTPTPTTPSIQEPVSTFTTEEPSKTPASLDPVVIVLIVIVIVVLLVIVITVVVYLWRKNLIQDFCFSKQDVSKRPSPKGDYRKVNSDCLQGMIQPVNPENTPNGPQDTTREDLQETAEFSEGTSTIAVPCDDPATDMIQPVNPENTPNGPHNTTREDLQEAAEFSEGTSTTVVPCDDPATDGPPIRPVDNTSDYYSQIVKDAMQGAVPIDDSEAPTEVSHDGPVNMSKPTEDRGGNSNTPSRGANSNAESQSQGSRNSGTQTDFDSITEWQEASQNDEFDKLLEQAVAATKDVKLDYMHRKDVELLNSLMHEKPELLEKLNPSRFHYGKLAKLFYFNAHEIRQMDNAEQVLSAVAARRKEQFTVADLLEKLVQSGECYDVVRRLMNQIVERQQH